MLTPLVLLVAGYGMWNVSLHRQEVNNALIGYARTLSLSIEHEITAAQAALATLALSPHLQDANFSAFYEEARKAVAPFQGWIVVADQNRQQLLNTLRPYGSHLPTGNAAEVTERVFAMGQPVISGVFRGRVAERPVVSISVPVYRSNRIVYEMRMAFLTNHFSGLLAREAIPPAWTAILIDATGQIISYMPAKDESLANTVGAWFRNGQIGTTPGIIEGISADNQTLAVAFHQSNATGWSAVIAAPTGVIDRPINTAAVLIVIGGLLSLALAVLAAVVLGRRIALPLQVLANQANSILRGAPAPTKGHSFREVEDLRSALFKASELSRRQFESELSLERERRAREHAEQTRAEIEKRERNIRRLIDSNLIGILIANEQRVIEANDVFLRMVGYSRHQLETGQIAWRKLTPPEQQALTDRALVELQTRGEVAPFEKEYLRADGSHIPVLIGKARIDADPQVMTWVCFVVDLTEQKRAAARLLASEQRYRGLTEAIASVVWTTGADGSATDMRQWQELTGQTPEAFAGWGWIDALHPDDRPGTRREWQQAIASGEPINIEFRVRTARGRYRWYNARGVPVRNADGSIREWVGVGFDIDSRKAAETRQLLLMAELDHRVRNILATVQSMISLTGAAVESKTEYAALLRGRIVAMARAHSLLSRQTWGGATLMQVVEDEIAPYADSGQMFVIEGDPDFVLRPKDALDFALVIHELTTNAAKYGALAQTGGQVRISWSVSGDNGGGRLVFRWQESGGPPVGPRRRRGFGSRLIENVFSVGAGRRSTCTFAPDGLVCVLEMPVSPQPGERDAADPPPPAIARSRAPVVMPPGRFLVVEDEPLIAMEMHRLLSQAGIEISGPAATLTEALDLARDQTLSGAVLDINLGKEAVYPVADHLLARHVPVVFLTGYGVGTIPDRFRQQPVLQKPVDPWLLLETVRIMLSPAESGKREGAGSRPDAPGKLQA